MLHIVLVEPEIPMNTGNVARTCAATGAVLHLVGPLGFSIDDRAVKRAGLDYWSLVDVRYYENLDSFFEANPAIRCHFASTKAPHVYTERLFKEGDFLFFGKETKGLPESLLRQHTDQCIRIPMISDARSLNLSNSVAVILYEALRQLEFPGLQNFGKMAEETDKSFSS